MYNYTWDVKRVKEYKCNNVTLYYVVVILTSYNIKNNLL